MLRRTRLFLFFILISQLGGCSFGGESGIFPRITYGVPARWLINEAVSGRVVDFASCKRGVDDKEGGVWYVSSTCEPVAGAEVTLSMGGVSREESIFTYAACTDENGRFHFERHTAIRFVDVGANFFDSGELIITAEGYPKFRMHVSWSGRDTPIQDLPQYDNNRFQSFMAGDAKNVMLLFLTVPGPQEQGRQ